MDNRRRHRESPARDVKTKIKQEKVSPARPPRVRRSSSGSSRGSSSPPPRRRDSRSPVRRKDRSPARRDRSSGRQQERSPRPQRSRSPHRSTDVRIKREQDDHRVSESHRHRERRDDSDDRRMKREGERPRQREQDREQNRNRGRERDAHLQQQAERERHNERRRENRLRQEAQSGSGNEEHEFGGENAGDSAPAAEKEKPNFELSGALVEDTNTFRGEVIKYNEPPEARIPKRRWRLYPFKNDEPLPVMYIHRQSAYLLGRQRKIADIPIDHPSCSKQHAVFQYRLVEFTRVDGTMGRRVKPYIIDLGSGNGTYLNNQRIEPQRYYELKEKDVLKFGFSSREYVLLHEFSDTAEVDAKKEDEEDEGLDE
ncbi:smad nuclear-interacting protein 1-like isoform X1 [Sinocyclocheilus anshuiensis]|uniref:Smad nuclear-interacting protein 1-like n=1 Tax=Sinocyclocheilus anshuiensis TaxID=1608454 RepID=A0A671RUK4_9TELE|nr:PREDICTED: smad nuclear-interacting protein 1-like isoform X1 [Sinocyclocheilus anshuiensis]